MNEDEKYLFDLNGYLVLKEILNDQEVKRLNAAIDVHSDEMQEIDRSLASDSKAMQGTSRRLDLGGMLSWDQPYCEPFRELLVQPRVKSILDGILGIGYRLDHGPGLIAMEKGCEGGKLHGGGVERGDISEVYFYKNDRIFTGLTVVEYLLADEGKGDGGVAVIPGSHKANVRCPDDLLNWDKYQEHVHEVNAKAGDVIIFTETLTHGTLPWTGSHQRRALLYKFSPGTVSYGAGSHDISYGDYIQTMTVEQRRVMESPHLRRS